MMPTQQLINEPAEVVPEALQGLQRAYPGLVRCHTDPTYVTRAIPSQAPKVVLVSGGGSGHEPLHTGFVGEGMLDAAVPGAVFASPTAHQIHAALAAVHQDQGALLIVKNYTGDVLNFSIAAELAADEDVPVDTVLVDDDLATESPDGPGRRGTAAVVAVEKICGAAAERGAALGEVAELGRRVVASARTLALASGACTHPGQARASFDLADGEVEFGVGIHGEHGVGRRPYRQASELVAELTRPVVQALSLRRGESVIAIVNGLGALPGLELAVVYREVARFLDGHGITIARALTGSYVTALDMRGCSVTLLQASEELLELWDAPVRTPALTW